MKPILIYDGDCGFCRRWILRWRRSTRDAVEYAPYQLVADQYPQIPREEFARAVRLVEPDGKVTRGAEAVFRALAAVPGKRWPLRIYEEAPGAAAACEWFYGLVARHRVLFSRITDLLWGPSLDPPRYGVARWIFLRALGLIYLIAFLSLGGQILGLAGSHGILPAESLLRAVRQQAGNAGYFYLPTLFWLKISDPLLRAACGGGAVLSCLLILDVAPVPLLVLLWALYLSLAGVCQDFLWFQWDNLLLEAGFLALFLAPLRIRPRARGDAPPAPLIVWLFHWLLFRLMFSSGACKLASGDAAWRNLTALSFHYETQPLPTWIAWFAHQMPACFQKFSAGALLFLEIVVPFLIFLPRRPRQAACALLIFLQVLIILTGNYCFFNLLSIALCLLLLDDEAFPAWARRLFAAEGARPSKSAGWLHRPLAALVLLVSVFQLSFLFHVPVNGPLPFQRIYQWAEPFRSINSYGLFAVMTTSRPEIIVEGSRDGKTWLPYEFKYKPGDPARRPRFVAPHQPRLDWQMWFAALGSYQENRWFIAFLAQLLQGSRDVSGLLERNPFPDAPPKFVRALVYDYHFTDREERKKTGDWWKREAKGLYCPVLALKS